MENSLQSAILSLLTNSLYLTFLLFIKLLKGNQYFLLPNQVLLIGLLQKVLLKIIGILLVQKFLVGLVKGNSSIQFNCQYLLVLSKEEKEGVARTNINKYIQLTAKAYYVVYSPRSPTARVHVATGGNIIWNPIPLDGQVQRRQQRAVAARAALSFNSVVMSPRRVQRIALNNTRSLTASAQSSYSTIQGGPLRETRIRKPPNIRLPGLQPGPKLALSSQLTWTRPRRIIGYPQACTSSKIVKGI